MFFRLKATKVILTDDVKDYIQKKMDMLEKYLGDIQILNVDVEIEKSIGSHQTGDIYRAEVNIEVPGDLLRVEKTEEDVFAAIDKVKDHLEILIKKHKEKLIDRNRK